MAKNRKVRDKEFLSFEDARALVRSKKVKSFSDWQELYLDGVPRHPNEIYENTGWVSWPDWFGPTYKNYINKAYRSFDQARAFAIGLGLRNKRAWADTSKLTSFPTTYPDTQRNLIKTRAGKAGAISLALETPAQVASGNGKKTLKHSHLQ